MSHEVLTVILTDEQRSVLEPLVSRQVQERRGLLLISVAPHVEEATNEFRLQAVFLDQKRANRVLKIVREDAKK